MKKTKFRQPERGIIPKGWKLNKIDDCLFLVKKQVFPSKENIIKYIGLEHLEQHSLRLNGIGSSRDVESNKYEFKKGQILFGKLRPYFRKVYLAKFDGLCSTDIWVIATKNNNDDTFFFYFLADYRIINEANNSSEGTRMPRAKWDYLKQLQFAIPPYSEQKAIASVLSSLDSKIELNQQTNKILETIGQTLFKRWFIDFEFPDEKWRPYKSSGGEMVDTELGEIPKGWKVGTVSNCGRVVCGKTPPTRDKENYGEDILFVTIPDMHNKTFIINTERKLSRLGAKTQPKKELSALSICVSCIATPGIVAMTSQKSHTNQQINSIVCHEGISPYYIYLTMKSKSEEIKSKGLGGTATLNLNTGNFEKIKVMFPSDEVLQLFHNRIENLFNGILLNAKEIANLTKLRDSLLPRLMSGKIRVPLEAR